MIKDDLIWVAFLYKVCGEACDLEFGSPSVGNLESVQARQQSTVLTPSHARFSLPHHDGWGESSSSSSGFSRPWVTPPAISASSVGHLPPNPLAKKRPANKNAADQIKKNIAYVKLAIIGTGKRTTLDVEIVKQSLYLKVHASSVCVYELLSEACTKIPGNLTRRPGPFGHQVHKD